MRDEKKGFFVFLEGKKETQKNSSNAFFSHLSGLLFLLLLVSVCAPNRPYLKNDFFFLSGSSPELVIVTFFAGEPEGVPWASMAFTTSIPSRTSPKTTCLPSSHEVTTVVMKNWFSW